MLPIFYPASSLSNVTFPNDHGLIGTLLALELSITCLFSSTQGILISTFLDQVPREGGWGSAKCPGMRKWRREEALGFLLCRVLVGTGYSSLQLARAPSTKLEVWLWEWQKQGCLKTARHRFS